MSPEEALTALTVNAAHAIGRGECVGRLAAGYQADILVLGVSRLEEIPYNMDWNPIESVVKGGQLVLGPGTTTEN